MSTPVKKHPYPPCWDLGTECFEIPCCYTAGYPKYEWPELVGVDGQKAKAIIEQQNPQVTCLIRGPGEPPFVDVCCNRVVIRVDNRGIVNDGPQVG